MTCGRWPQRGKGKELVSGLSKKVPWHAGQCWGQHSQRLLSGEPGQGS